jgi:hypothetical protein
MTSLTHPQVSSDADPSFAERATGALVVALFGAVVVLNTASAFLSLLAA